MKDHDKIRATFSIEDDFVDGGTELTTFTKEVSVVAEVESHLEVITDLFIRFLISYGYQQSTILKMFNEFVEEGGIV